MTQFLNFIKKYLIFILLFLYALFHHVSSSEFWPITISKTWLDFSNFEYSLLQKPLFSLFLSLFHLLPLSDIQHLLLVKAIFSVFGAFSIWLFVKVLLTLSGNKNLLLYQNLLSLLVVTISPIFLDNFFRIRTDQLSFLFFVGFIYFNYKADFTKSLVLLLFLSLISIKGLIFVAPGLYLLYSSHHLKIKQLKKLHLYYIISGFLALILWFINLNAGSLSYLKETYSSMNFPNYDLKKYFITEIFYIIGSVLISLYLIYKNNLQFKKYAYISLYFLVLIIILPQSYSFYIASLSPFVELPIILFILSHTKLNMRNKLIILYSPALYLIPLVIFNQLVINYNSFNEQYKFISQISPIIGENDLTYLDGMGILPKQKLVHCFVSPDDYSSNLNCLSTLQNHNVDSVIVTSRLFTLGEPIFKSIESGYEQILPNFWIKKERLTLPILQKKNLESPSALPILIF